MELFARAPVTQTFSLVDAKPLDSHPFFGRIVRL